MTYCNDKGMACELATISGHCSVSACRKVILTPKGSRPMSEQMQKLATRYERATGKKFCNNTNARKIRSMSDDELAKLFATISGDKVGGTAKFWLEWLQQPAEEEPK